MYLMRPVSDLKTYYEEISRTVHESGDPLILTKNGRGDMVVFSYEAYERLLTELGRAMEKQAAEEEPENKRRQAEHEQTVEKLRARILDPKTKE